MGKEYSRVVSSSKDIQGSYSIAKKVMETSKMKFKKDKCGATGFELSGKESMKWITTNWPTTVTIKSDVMDGKVYFNLYAKCGGTSSTQDAHTQEVLNNISSSIEAYCK